MSRRIGRAEMTNVQLAAWVAVIGAGAVIVAFVGAEALLYFLRVRSLARMSRERSPEKRHAGQAPAAEGRAAKAPLSAAAPFAARRPGGVARTRVAPAPGAAIDPK
jgi:hypothetical protein